MLHQQQQQQHLHCRRKATATTTARLVIFSSPLLLLLLTTHLPPTLQADNGPAPQVAALAAPNPAGGVAGSSIIDQFSPNCSAVTHIFQARGIDAIEIPQKPSNGMSDIIYQWLNKYLSRNIYYCKYLNFKQSYNYFLCVKWSDFNFEIRFK